jgi:hypothetical protein
MLKRLNPQISVGFVVASLFWIAVLGWQSSYSFPENEKQRCYEEAKKSGHKNEECKTFWERTTSDPVAFFTFTLTVVTLALGAISVRQFYYLRRADETARIAANAADLSARAAIAVQLPVVRVEPVGFGWGRSQEGDNPETEYFGLQCFDLTNLGRTDAFPVEIRWGWFVGDKLPDIPIYVHRKRFEIDAILRPEKRIVIYVTGFEMLIEPGDTARIVRNNITLWLYSRVVYLDFMQTRHEADFCWKRLETFGGGRLVLDATPAYNPQDLEATQRLACLSQTTAR